MPDDRLIGMRDADNFPILKEQGFECEGYESVSLGSEVTITVPDKAVSCQLRVLEACFLSHKATGTAAAATRIKIKANTPTNVPIGNQKKFYILPQSGNITEYDLLWGLATTPEEPKDDGQLQ